MNGGHGKWLNWMTRFYYVSGTFYYVYNLIIITGLTGLLTAATWIWKGRSPVIASVITTVSFCAILTGISFARRAIRIQLASLNPCLKIQKIAVDYSYNNEFSCDYVRTVDVIVRYPVDHYRAKFKWSSEGVIKPAILSGARALSVDDMSASVFNICRVVFDRMLNKNETHSFAYQLCISGAKHPIKKYLGHTVDSPTEKLILVVKLADTITEYRRQLLLSSASEMPLWEEKVTVVDPWKKKIDWEIQNAKHGYYYRLAW